MSRPHLFRFKRYCDRTCLKVVTSRRFSGSDAADLARAEYRVSSEGIEAQRRYNRSERGWATRQRYASSEKGRAAIKRKVARRLASYSSLYYKNRYQMIYVESLSCAQCGELDTLKLDVDHVVPRALGGSDERSNLQVLCGEPCHRKKTELDLERIWYVRRQAVSAI